MKLKKIALSAPAPGATVVHKHVIVHGAGEPWSSPKRGASLPPRMQFGYNITHPIYVTQILKVDDT